MSLILAVLALAMHELGHCIGAWLSGLQVKGVVLNWRGVGIRRTAGTATQNLLVTAAGPILSCLLGISFWGTKFGLLNMVIAVTTMLPLKDSDGYKLLSGVFRPATLPVPNPSVLYFKAPRSQTQIGRTQDQPVPLRRAA